MAVPDLVAKYREVYGKEPRVKNREWLWKRISWRVQEQRFGGLSQAAKGRLEDIIRQLDLPLTESQRTVTGKLARPPRPGDPVVGTTLTRNWRGSQIEVRVVEGGYEYQEVLYRSLSAVALAVTGSRWNGRLFFNLTARKRKP